MTFELDHVFVCTSAGAPEADHLVALGLTEGAPNRHPGQGTANRRFFFTNAFLELLWVEDAGEAQGELARPLRLWERWSGRGSGACPFGICLRPARPGGEELPFPAWEYRPPYLPQPLVLHIGTNSASIDEPLLFHAPFGRRGDTMPTPRRQPMDHAIGFRELTAVRLFGPRGPAPSAVVRAAEQTGAVAFRDGPEYRLEIGFDEEEQGRCEDLRPVLPVVICW